MRTTNLRVFASMVLYRYLHKKSIRDICGFISIVHIVFVVICPLTMSIAIFLIPSLFKSILVISVSFSMNTLSLTIVIRSGILNTSFS